MASSKQPAACCRPSRLFHWLQGKEEDGRWRRRKPSDAGSGVTWAGMKRDTHDILWYARRIGGSQCWYMLICGSHEHQSSSIMVDTNMVTCSGRWKLLVEYYAHVPTKVSIRSVHFSDLEYHYSTWFGHFECRSARSLDHFQTEQRT